MAISSSDPPIYKVIIIIFTQFESLLLNDVKIFSLGKKKDSVFHFKKKK